jgi:hypothetical protein
MDTKAWGPPLWKSMFIIAANYPVEIDHTNNQHLAKRRYYKSFFVGMKNILPCKYCRRSYAKFLKELPIDKFLDSRNMMMYWLYLMKDKVNRKLIAQEKQNKSEFKTKPSPPFHEVCAKYEKYRAKCSDKTKTCSVPQVSTQYKITPGKYTAANRVSK